MMMCFTVLRGSSGRCVVHIRSSMVHLMKSIKVCVLNDSERICVAYYLTLCAGNERGGILDGASVGIDV